MNNTETKYTIVNGSNGWTLAVNNQSYDHSATYEIEKAILLEAIDNLNRWRDEHWKYATLYNQDGTSRMIDTTK